MPELDQNTEAFQSRINLLENIGFGGWFFAEDDTYILQGYSPGQWIYGYHHTTGNTVALGFYASITKTSKPRGRTEPKNLRRLGFE